MMRWLLTLIFWLCASAAWAYVPPSDNLPDRLGDVSPPSGLQIIHPGGNEMALFNGLLFSIKANEQNSGTLIDQITGAPVAGKYTWEATNGVNLKTSDHILTLPRDQFNLPTGTVLFHFKGDGTPTSYGKFIAAPNDVDFQICRNGLDNENTGTLTDINHSHGRVVFRGHVDLWDGNDHIIVYRWSNGDVSNSVWGTDVRRQLIVDSLWFSEDDTAQVQSTFSSDLSIGNRSSDTARSAGITLYGAHVWDRVLTDAEITTLLSDPYAMFGQLLSMLKKRTKTLVRF